MGPAIVSQPDGPRTDALVEAEGDREAIHWRRPSFNLSWGQWAHLDTTTRRGSAKRNAAFTLQHGAMLTTRQPEGCVPVVVSRCAPLSRSDGLLIVKSSQRPQVHLNRTKRANLPGNTFTRFMVPPHTGHFNASPFMGVKNRPYHAAPYCRRSSILISHALWRLRSVLIRTSTFSASSLVNRKLAGSACSQTPHRL